LSKDKNLLSLLKYTNFVRWQIKDFNAKQPHGFGAERIVIIIKSC